MPAHPSLAQQEITVPVADTSHFEADLENYLDTLRLQFLYRSRKCITKPMVNFSSNDYLSFASNSEIKRFYQQGFKQYPCGSSGSMYLSGYHPIHQQVEEAFAKALKVDGCILYPSGYSANLSIIRLIETQGWRLLLDKSAHASFYDGLKQTQMGYTRYLSNDMHSLEKKIKLGEKNIILTEGIFSMSGEQGNVNAIRNLAHQYHFPFIVDEAHSFGILGPHGMGAVAGANLSQSEVPLRVIPLGKAFAATGAIVAGKKVWIEALLQSSRSLIYSTAMSPAFSFGLLKTLNKLRDAEEEREKLFHLIHYFRKKVQTSALQWRDSRTPIQQLLCGCPQTALHYMKKLLETNILCFAVRKPTVPKNETGLRVILNSNHTFADIDYLFQHLDQFTIHQSL